MWDELTTPGSRVPYSTEPGRLLKIPLNWEGKSCYFNLGKSEVLTLNVEIEEGYITS